LEGEDGEQLTTSSVPELPGLSDEQKAQIREVLRRAEKSQKDARVIVDPKHLWQLRESNFRGTLDESEEMFTVENESVLVQMDSIPETLEVIAIPAPPPSVATSYTEQPPSSLSSMGSNNSTPAKRSPQHIPERYGTECSSADVYYTVLEEEQDITVCAEEFGLNNETNDFDNKTPSERIRCRTAADLKLENIIRLFVDELWKHIVIKVLTESAEILSQNIRSMDSVNSADTESDNQSESDGSAIDYYRILSEEYDYEEDMRARVDGGFYGNDSCIQYNGENFLRSSTNIIENEKNTVSVEEDQQAFLTDSNFHDRRREFIDDTERSELSDPIKKNGRDSFDANVEPKNIPHEYFANSIESTDSEIDRIEAERRSIHTISAKRVDERNELDMQGEHESDSYMEAARLIVEPSEENIKEHPDLLIQFASTPSQEPEENETRTEKTPEEKPNISAEEFTSVVSEGSETLEAVAPEEEFLISQESSSTPGADEGEIYEQATGAEDQAAGVTGAVFSTHLERGSAEAVLTQEEHEHIEYVKRLAEQDSLERQLHEEQEKHKPSVTEEYELTQEEIEHIESVKRMAEAEPSPFLVEK
uniref:LIM zinc-binding domain-containing protein n=1 Tax=Anisakis simplex TaxID=6269 RepID=A0A0M3K1Z8_ANISI